MKIRKVFDIMNHADDESVNRLAHYPAADKKVLDRMYALTQEKLSAPETEETFIEPPAPRLQWTRAAIVASALVICGTAAAGIGALSRMTPPEETYQTAEVTPAASAEETIPEEETEAVTSEASETVPAVIVTETQIKTETQPTEGTAVSAETTVQTVSTAVQSVVEMQTETVPTAVTVQLPAPSAVQDAPIPAETAAAPEESVQAESLLPGFILTEGQIEHDGVEPECDALIGDTGWYLRADADTAAAPAKIETAYLPTQIPERLFPQQKNSPFQEIFSEDSTLYMKAWNEGNGLRFLDYVQKPLSAQLEFPDYDGAHVPTFTPASVNGHPAVFVRFWQTVGENVALYSDVELVWDTYPANDLVWQDGQYLYHLRSLSSLTDEELLSIAESLEPVS